MTLEEQIEQSVKKAQAEVSNRIGEIGAANYGQCNVSQSEPFPLSASLTNQRNHLLLALRRLDAQLAFVQEHPEVEGLGFDISHRIGY